jgi:hypothetical protein
MVEAQKLSGRSVKQIGKAIADRAGAERRGHLQNGFGKFFPDVKQGAAFPRGKLLESRRSFPSGGPGQPNQPKVLRFGGTMQIPKLCKPMF